MNDIESAVKTVLAVAEMIRELGEIPSGHLYVMTVGHWLSVTDYDSVIGTLKRTGLVEESGHLLRWVGPQAGVSA